MAVYIAGTGVHHPEERITNADLEKILDTNDAWIQSHTGIQERTKAPEGMFASDLGALAVVDALREANWQAKDLDLIVCATSTPDTLVPPTACHIGKKLGISPPSFDVDAACAGFLFGLSTAVPMVESGRFKRVALVATEHYTRFANYEDRATCIFWGDAGACVLLQPEKPKSGFEIVDFDIQSMTEGTDYVKVPVRGYVEQDGPMVKKYAEKGFVQSATTILERNGLTPNDVDAFVGHQANYRLLEIVIEKLGIPAEKHWHTVRLYGNRGAAGAPATLIGRSRESKLPNGSLLLMTVFGAGFCMASALFRSIADE
ncbi:MAG: beta-ketoacyl-ACP synthase 3 [Planctomycetota bacterium]